MTAPVRGPRLVSDQNAAGTLLEVRGLDKHFGPVQALTSVDLDLPPGQVTCLVGDNGAGKSVLTKCINGIYQPDHGQIFWDGEPVHILFLLVSPPDRPGDHLRALENISRHLRNDNFCNFLRQAPSAQAVIELLEEADNNQLG